MADAAVAGLEVRCLPAKLGRQCWPFRRGVAWQVVAVVYAASTRSFCVFAYVSRNSSRQSPALIIPWTVQSALLQNWRQVSALWEASTRVLAFATKLSLSQQGFG